MTDHSVQPPCFIISSAFSTLIDLQNSRVFVSQRRARLSPYISSRLSSPRAMLRNGAMDAGMRNKLSMKSQNSKSSHAVDTHNWYPSKVMTAIVPSLEIQKTHSLNLPVDRCITCVSGSVNIVQRASRRRELPIKICQECNLLRRELDERYADLDDQIAMEPSSQPPTIISSPDLSFRVTCILAMRPSRGISDS